LFYCGRPLWQTLGRNLFHGRVDWDAGDPLFSIDPLMSTQNLILARSQSLQIGPWNDLQSRLAGVAISYWGKLELS
jgi:hypothetical protein